MSSETSGSVTLLDELLPEYAFRSRYARTIAADPPTVWASLDEIPRWRLPVTGLLMGVRTLGAKRLRSGPPTLATVDGVEQVRGAVAKFWRLKPTVAPIPDPAAFAGFTEPGWAKAAMSVRLTARGSGTEVVVETRVQPTSSEARRRFAPYWWLIKLGGAGLIRLELLSALAWTAERRARTCNKPANA
ncbi:MAG: hypothetical protein HOV71_13585 [Hamadaea sp.]|nr:hypothetical protein [Hamadaea sp.]NUR49162.1 hypothetical protein [Hamadaea sp.]NUT03956.1 hypothetical protein [Hamadaea sp.]